jgi:hypothetical protein
MTYGFVGGGSFSDLDLLSMGLTLTLFRSRISRALAESPLLVGLGTRAR